MRHITLLQRQGRRCGLPLLTAVLACCAARNATAAIEISISPVTKAVAGSNGDSFDVTLTNTGASAITLGGFTFELSTPGSLITFTSATINTSPTYIFAGTSVFNSPISYSPPGSVLDALDNSLSGGSVGAGATVGLGHVLFNVSASAPATVVPVTFTGYPTTSLSDTSGHILGDVFSLATGATIDIGGINSPSVSVIPEPSAWIVWAGCGALGLIGFARRRQAGPVCQLP